MLRWPGVLLVLFLLTRPELMHLGLLIDAVGLDTFLLLLEVQLLMVLGLAYRQSLRPLLGWCRRRMLRPLLLASRALFEACAMARTALRALDGGLLRHSGPFGLWAYVHGRAYGRHWLCRAMAA
ncbi:hypothetical protein [Frateuria defendens]|uniref:hypothetical protein n=1 Tax=Frateuria defendens TaxID=2219559 RepID=UPI00066FE916|nr:hypothetical protein [Frateuria defendens]